ncbi:ubiquinone-binding protein [Luteibacter rhizovicinus DSM 16549]|uniref:Ubiquinone-binding protein n=1 Tax=Luteibacter rhizovicinus DSM 16549 TaxID=1440763 RepID=A0A0G9HG62_9GAMM|nr:type II toxin-antitoxin system RatA family toxin [Luteibacter rhizovicinus]APG06088.1 ubiquinone-binding protein [Luteibacter rhizovicinus DSM 16549]KLD68698.1 oligoketide cyclase [Luteibacter rhizovicinus DSM 16549]KLD73549.1 oligoketide cyclase [Xanthomonas hyacinthi DSM 19077]
MIEIRRSAIVPFTPAQMFDLVNDVEAYPKRFGWCDAAEVLEREDNVLVARLDLKFAGIKQSFTTRNTTDKPHSLAMKFVEGPFRSLDGVFTFQALGDVGCKIALALDFDYAGLGGAVLRMGFQQLANRMVDDFCDEARRQYG